MEPLDSFPRLPGWEARLNAVLADAYAKPYELGRHDCFRLACSVIQALIGVDRWPEFAGRYTTQRQCLALLARHGASFTEAGAWFFGAPPVTWRLARRGDLCEWRDAQGGAHLVVCRGADCVGLVEVRDGGLAGQPLPGSAQAIPLDACRHAWRVG